jgi:hypothetical protein
VNKIQLDSVPIYRGFYSSARDRCGLKPHAFFVRIRGHFHRGVEIGEIFSSGALSLSLDSASLS